jgi:WD40 repeat protein
MPKSVEIALAVVMGWTAAISLRGQVEAVNGQRAAPVWSSRARIEGHLALSYSPAGAFSPDNSLLAAVNEDKVMLVDLRAGIPGKALHAHIQDIADLQLQSASFLDAHTLFLLGTGMMHVSGEGRDRPSPLLGFEWDIEKDALAGKVDAVGAKGGFGPARYFPQIGYLALYKDSTFDLWSPRGGGGGRIVIPDLTQAPNLFEFSPDGHWLLLAQIVSNSTADPVVVLLKEHRFVDSLRGHQGTVLGMAFSRDCKRVVTACEDGKVRIFSVPDWKLLQTLTGHQGPVHWAEFSPDGAWVASAGEDKTVRIWSSEDGKLIQSLEESQAPLLTVAFSPNGESVAASSEHVVLIWQRIGGGRL